MGGNKIIEARLMFPHKPQSTAWREKKGLSSPKKAFTNNTPELAIRNDEETEYCRVVKNASRTERKHLAQKDLILPHMNMIRSELFILTLVPLRLQM